MEINQNWANISWTYSSYREIIDVGERGGSIVILPIGSVEQHGHHLPVGTDTILVDAIAKSAAERVYDDIPILVAPPFWLGSSPHHLSMGGTISGSHQTLIDIFEQIIRCVVDNDFDSVLVINGHGGNKALVESLPRIVGPQYYPEVDISSCTYFELPDRERIAEIRESNSGGMGHAGEFETSLMLYFYPNLVDEEMLEGTMGDGDMFDSPSPVVGYGTVEDTSSTGTIGNPRVATAEKGGQFRDEVCSRLVELLYEKFETKRANEF